MQCFADIHGVRDFVFPREHADRYEKEYPKILHQVKTEFDECAEPENILVQELVAKFSAFPSPELTGSRKYSAKSMKTIRILDVLFARAREGRIEGANAMRKDVPATSTS